MQTKFRQTVIFALLVLLMASVLWAKNEQFEKILINDLKINQVAGSADYGFPAIAANEYGYAVIVWSHIDGGYTNSRILFQQFTEKGLAYRNNRVVSDLPGNNLELHPDVAMNDQGEFVIVWEDSRNGTRDILAQRFFANGEPNGDLIQVNQDVTAADQTHPAIAMNGAGDFVVCWEDGRNGHDDIYAQRFDSEGNRTGANFRVNDSNAWARNLPNVAMNADGNFVIVWQDGRNSGVADIYAQRFNANGAPEGSNYEVSDHVGQEMGALNPAVAMQPNGEYLIAWHIGLTPSVAAHVYNRDGSAKGDLFWVGGTGSNGQDAAVTVLPGMGYSVLSASNVAGSVDIWGRNIDFDGNPVGPSFRVSDIDGGQQHPDFVVDSRGIALIVWDDDRNGGHDIYGCWLGALKPLDVTAGSGFNGLVPLSWDHIYGFPAIDHYNIYRSTTSGDGYSLLTSVDLSERGPLGRQMRDYIDTDVVNGTTYYYRIRAVASGTEGPPSDEVHATPDGNGHRVNSHWTSGSPAIDGTISDGEWDDAATLNIASPFAPHAITLYVMNDAGHLYLAVEDSNDWVVNQGNQFGLLFDENHDRAWDSEGPSQEGALLITDAGAGFIGYWGTYPNHLGADAPLIPAPGVEKAISASSGRVQYEIVLDLATSPLNTTAGDTLGVAIWVLDPEHFFPLYYGNSAEWPLGALWEAAAPLGDFILAQEVPHIPGKLLASDGNAGDKFGRSVAIDSDYAVVGAPYDDNENGVDAGAVYIFKRDESGWIQETKLVPSDGDPDELFGYSVDLDGDYLAVGSCWDDTAGEKSGSVYIYRHEGMDWIKEDKVIAENAGPDQRFGISVAINNGRLLAGAFFDSEHGTHSGVANILRQHGTDWRHEAKLVASDAAENDWFGVSVDLDGDYAVVAARYDDNERGTDAGAAYVFNWDGSTWAQQTKLMASDGAAGDRFDKVTIWGNWIAVGARQDDDNGTNSGSVYLFRREGNTWLENAKIVAPDGAANDLFGAAVAGNGNALVVGAPGDDGSGEDAGSIYIFKRIGEEWRESQKITASDGEAGDYFGAALAVSPHTVLAGAKNDDDKGHNAGAAYVNEWVSEVKKLRVPEEYVTISAAMAAASYGDTVLVAAGTYSEFITIRPGVTLTAEAGPQETILSRSGVAQLVMGARDAVISGFTIAGNNNGAGLPGNGIYSSGDNFTVHHCIIRDNRVGIYLDNGSQATVYNNTIFGNNLAGIYMQIDPSPTIYNNIIVNNTTNGIFRKTTGALGDPVLQYNCYYGNGIDFGHDGDSWTPEPGTGSIFEEPLFVGGSPFDYSLAAGSLCIDAGDPDSPADPDGSRADMGAIYYQHPTGVDGKIAVNQPKDFCLHPAYPNPFNPTTTIEFDVARSSDVQLTVYNMLGRQVAELVNQQYKPGRYKAIFRASQLPSGLYFYRIRMGGFRQTRKMLLVR